MRRARAYGFLGALGLLTVLVSGCDVEVTGGTKSALPEKRVEQKISDKLTQMIGKRPQKVDCPHGLDAKVGQTMRCVLTSDRARLGVTVTVDSADGGQVHFKFKVDEQPLPSATN